MEWRGARVSEGPNAWWRPDNQDAYYIEVRDHHGLIRTGYIVYASFWFPYTGRIHVTWNWPPRRRAAVPPVACRLSPAACRLPPVLCHHYR